jgi:lipid A 3-O-deacylase
MSLLNRLSPCLLVAVGAALATPLHAQGLRDDSRGIGMYAQVGRAGANADALTIGLTAPWSWRAMDGALTGYWDVFASHWRFDGSNGNQAVTQVGLVPTLRWRFDGGRSPWFAEAGTGPTITDALYAPRNKTAFSTRFNFASHIGFGYTFGADRSHELGLRVQHVSNAGIKKPNPGEDFLQLRYGWKF